MLVAIFTAIGLLVTIAGWIYTARHQKQLSDRQLETQTAIAQIQRESNADLERLRYVTPLRLARIDEITQWLEQGRLYWRQADDIKTAIEYQEGPGAELPAGIGRQVFDWHRSSDRLVELARLYDPLSADSPMWEWGQTPLPKDLPQLVEAVASEVYDFFWDQYAKNQDFYGGFSEPAEPREHPEIPGLYSRLYFATLAAIERVRDHIATSPK